MSSRLYHVAYWGGQRILIPTSIPDCLREFVDISHLTEKEDDEMITFKAKVDEMIERRQR